MTTSEAIPYEMLIGDKWLPAQSGSRYTSDNPYNGNDMQTCPKKSKSFKRVMQQCCQRGFSSDRFVTPRSIAIWGCWPSR